uniref:Uncharacterized protein n=1 Tax=Pyxicephalus adspersus TaxID=30357 RepID=A0AAV3AII8_PYXAD|nr:TPA: hypothetical protein GDO54_010583 [Pyxicephalus adspersus]
MLPAMVGGKPPQRNTFCTIPSSFTFSGHVKLLLRVSVFGRVSSSTVLHQPCVRKSFALQRPQDSKLLRPGSSRPGQKMGNQ